MMLSHCERLILGRPSAVKNSNINSPIVNAQLISTRVAAGLITCFFSSKMKKNDAEACVFCKIVNGQEGNEIYFQDDGIVVFSDIRPAASHHLLVVPRKHIRDAQQLRPSDLPLFDRLISVGNQVMDTRLTSDPELKGTDHSKIPKLLGFHWPPFMTILHLHLHVIAPSDKMKSKLFQDMFRPNSHWFVSVFKPN